MFCTSRCRTMSDWSSCTTAMFLMPFSFCTASASPLGVPSGRSTWLASPVTIIFDSWPSRVKNISICATVVFCASSRMMTASFSVRPRMNASGTTSITSLTMNRLTCSKSIMSFRASNSGRRYGFTLACKSPGRNPSRSPASTAGRARTSRLARAPLEDGRGGGHGQVRLAGAGRAGADRQVVGEDGLEVGPLALGLGPDGVALGEHLDLAVVPLAVDLGGRPDRLAHVLHAEPVLPPQLLLHLVQDLGGPADLLGVAAHPQLVVAADDLDAERLAEQPQVAVGRAEQGELLPGLFEGDAEVHGWGMAARGLGRVRVGPNSGRIVTVAGRLSSIISRPSGRRAAAPAG